MNSTAAVVRDVMAAVFAVPAADIDETTSPETLESWDSLRHLNLVLALEQRFGVQFSVDEMAELQDHPSIVAQVDRLLHAEPALARRTP